jgi:hypothetical protein
MKGGGVYANSTVKSHRNGEQSGFPEGWNVRLLWKK